MKNWLSQRIFNNLKSLRKETWIIQYRVSFYNFFSELPIRTFYGLRCVNNYTSFLDVFPLFGRGFLLLHYIKLDIFLMFVTIDQFQKCLLYPRPRSWYTDLTCYDPNLYQHLANLEISKSIFEISNSKFNLWFFIYGMNLLKFANYLLNAGIGLGRNM